MERVATSGWQSTRNREPKWFVKKLFCKEIFMQERNALAQVCHSNIIRLIDYSETESPVLIFEYAENGNLLKCLKSSASNFSTSKLLVISADVACGMLELEKRGIIRDEPILLFFSPIFLSGNSFFPNLFCSKFMNFAQ